MICRLCVPYTFILVSYFRGRSVGMFKQVPKPCPLHCCVDACPAPWQVVGPPLARNATQQRTALHAALHGSVWGGRKGCQGRAAASKHATRCRSGDSIAAPTEATGALALQLTSPSALNPPAVRLAGKAVNERRVKPSTLVIIARAHRGAMAKGTNG